MGGLVGELMKGEGEEYEGNQQIIEWKKKVDEATTHVH